MKILTLNTHSLLEDDYEEKCRIFAEGTKELMPDIIVLQEVNQRKDGAAVHNTDRTFSVGRIALRENNHALKVRSLLTKKGISYFLVWAGIKKCFDTFDEGIAILSLSPIENAVSFAVSQVDDYENWKTRKALVARTQGITICTTHLGWWNDKEEPFEKQFLKLNEELSKRDCSILAGDFNSPDAIRGEGYELVLSKGWQDTFCHAKAREGSHTVSGPIAGWNQKDDLRIDYIFLKDNISVKSCRTVFDGERFGRVSDHFGVIADIERSSK